MKDKKRKPNPNILIKRIGRLVTKMSEQKIKYRVNLKAIKDNMSAKISSQKITYNDSLKKIKDNMSARVSAKIAIQKSRFKERIDNKDREIDNLKYDISLLSHKVVSVPNTEYCSMQKDDQIRVRLSSEKKEEIRTASKGNMSGYLVWLHDKNVEGGE